MTEPSPSPLEAGRHDQAVRDVRELPRVVEGLLNASYRTGAFQERWNAIVARAESEGTDGDAALQLAAQELMIDFVELLRAVLLEREKATFELLRT